MLREMLCPALLLALIASTQGRAVNISNTWVLPEEGFPVFYRYFRDRISWYEADAVCQFHHANLVTVDTTGQYDAVRAYLKELDISSAVWVGLIRSNPDGEFTWTDYRGLSNDGYWSSAPDARAAPLCAAADPAADYRWQARACGGPTVASFICELPVPQWAIGNEGCMVKALPALTVLYLPESAAVQLTADCGFTGVKRVQCTGNVKREELLKNLSCTDYDTSTDSGTPAPTDFAFNFTDEDTTSDATSDENVSTANETDAPKQEPTQLPIASIKLQSNQNTDSKVGNELSAKIKNLSYKNINLDVLHDNNLHNNDIPKNTEHEDEQTQKLEDEKNMQHKLLHDELAQHGNFETIFSQSTDHFVPPLVMAKAKVSDDMTVLSLAEKLAQQIAGKHSMKHNLASDSEKKNFDFDKLKISQLSTEIPNNGQIFDKPLVMILKPNKVETTIEKSKLRLPKKYLSKEKYDGAKAKSLKIDNKLARFEKTTEAIKIATEITTSKDETASSLPSKLNKTHEAVQGTDIALNEPSLKEVPEEINGSDEKNTESFISSAKNKLDLTSETTTNYPIENSSLKPSMKDITMNHEIIKITLISDKLDGTAQAETVIEITTRIPEIIEENKTTLKSESQNSKTVTETVVMTKVTNIPDTKIEETVATIEDLTTDAKPRLGTEFLSTKTDTVAQQTSTMTAEILAQTHTNESTNNSHVDTTTTTAINVDSAMKGKPEVQNVTGEYNEDDIDYSHSPLLSAANEPLHRPNRIRRPQIQLNQKSKFNPFRILG